MQDMPFLINDADMLGAEYTGLIHQPTGHNAVSSQEVIHREGIQFIQPLINLVSVLDLHNIFGRSQNLLAVQNCRDLFQCQRVLLDGQRAMNCPDAIGASQHRVSRKLVSG